MLCAGIFGRTVGGCTACTASMAKGLSWHKCVFTSERITRCTHTTSGPEHPHTEELPSHAWQHDLRMYPGFESHSPWAAHASQRVSTSRQLPLRTRARAAGSATLLQPGPAAAAAHRAPLQPSTRAGRPGAAGKGKQNDQVCAYNKPAHQHHSNGPTDTLKHLQIMLHIVQSRQCLAREWTTLRGDKICMSRRFDPYSRSAPLRFGLLHVAAKGADMDPLRRAPLLPFGDRAAAMQAALIQLAVGPQAAARSARSELAPGRAAAAKRASWFAAGSVGTERPCVRVAGAASPAALPAFTPKILATEQHVAMQPRYSARLINTF